MKKGLIRAVAALFFIVWAVSASAEEQRVGSPAESFNKIATGRVQVLDTTPEKAQEIAEVASNTDGIIFHLWPTGARIPNGDVMFPTAVSHTPRENLNVE